MTRARAWLAARTPAQILGASLALFWIYCWPGFVGWDTLEHLLQARRGVYTDGHPPAIARLQWVCDLFVAGPLLMMLLQSFTLILGLYWLFRVRVVERTAAWIAAAIFLFPPISGVQALVAKDGLMAGSLMIAIALMANTKRARPVLVLLFLLGATLMRWNALAATFAPTLLLFRWRLDIPGVKRYAIAALAWVVVTGAAFKTNELLTDQEEHLWYWSYAYEDIAGTLQHLPDIDDATMLEMLDGVPLTAQDRLHERFREIYDPLNFYQLVRPPTALFLVPAADAERRAVYAAWKRIVLGNLREYLEYRVENFMVVMMLDRSRPSHSNVYVWLSVIAAPETIPLIDHDASFSRIGAVMRDASIWISLTPLYYTFIYFIGCVLVAVLGWRRVLDPAVALSGIGYQLQWFFLAATPDYRYSQWMVICGVVAGTLFVTRVWQSRASRRTG